MYISPASIDVDDDTDDGEVSLRFLEMSVKKLSPGSMNLNQNNIDNAKLVKRQFGSWCQQITAASQAVFPSLTSEVRFQCRNFLQLNSKQFDIGKSVNW